MNAIEILENGHQTVLRSVEGLDKMDWLTPGVCGVWSVKEIIAHLTSFEQVLVDALNSVLNHQPTPSLDRFRADYEQFNQLEVNRRRSKTIAEVLAEYNEAHVQATQLLAQIPAEPRQIKGIFPWYGPDYDLEDFLVYTFYGHKQEHCAQIGAFRERLARDRIAVRKTVSTFSQLLLEG